jgi:hypothetical protein
MLEKRYDVTPAGQYIGTGAVVPIVYGRLTNTGPEITFGPASRPPVRRSMAGDDDVEAADDGDAGGPGDGDNGDGNGDSDSDSLIGVNQGIDVIDAIGEAPSGVRVSFDIDPVTGAPGDGTPDDPPSYTVPAGQSAVGMHEVPWQAEQPGDLPPNHSNPYTQVWPGKAVIVGQQTPYGSDDEDG